MPRKREVGGSNWWVVWIRNRQFVITLILFKIQDIWALEVEDCACDLDPVLFILAMSLGFLGECMWLLFQLSAMEYDFREWWARIAGQSLFQVPQLNALTRNYSSVRYCNDPSSCLIRSFLRHQVVEFYFWILTGLQQVPQLSVLILSQAHSIVWVKLKSDMPGWACDVFRGCYWQNQK